MRRIASHRGTVGDDEAVLSTRDDRVLPYTRVLSAVIVPFLVGAWIILYLFPDDTKRLFAWTIRPTMTPMVCLGLSRRRVLLRPGAVGAELARRQDWLSRGHPLRHTSRCRHDPALGQVQSPPRHVLDLGRALLQHPVPGLRRLAGESPACGAGGARRTPAGASGAVRHRLVGMAACSRASSCSPRHRWCSRTGRGC